jgi:glycosyltransferase involved in cell wall biosynthesis
MRVLHLTTEFPPIIYGGLGVAAGGLVRGLARSGLPVAVLLFGPTAGGAYGEFRPVPRRRPKRNRTTAGGITIFEVSWFQDVDTIVRTVASWRPDVLHLHSFWIWHIAHAIRSKLGIPVVYTVHSLDRAEYELGRGPPECVGQWAHQETVIGGADRIISLTQSERELLVQYCPGTEGRIRVIGNGIEDVGGARKMRGARESPVVLFAGRFVERKGIHELMEAIGLVLAVSPGVRFVLAGGHRDCPGEQMETWLLPPGLYRYREQIKFTGWLSTEEMAAWYRAADILVVPSWYEPFGMVVLEGMIHGLAVAASEVGGPAEILEHGKTGLLFPACDAHALAQSILQLTGDPDRRARIAQAGADEVRRHWLWPQIVDQVRDVYEELVPH